MALELVPQTAEARAHMHPLGISRSSAIRNGTAAEGSFGLTPGELHAIYDLPTQAPSTQTIAIVDAYNDPGIEADLKAYDQAFGLPECTRADECLTEVNQNGVTAELPFPSSDRELTEYELFDAEYREFAEYVRGWLLEISLDVETAHATCQNCRILLVEAKGASDVNLNAAERTADSEGATEISDSWGGPETEEDARISAFEDPGTVVTAAAGDDGYLDWVLEEEGEGEAGSPNFPASSPDVIAVGGTRLNPGGDKSWPGETVWNDEFGATGGGCSGVFKAPAWQLSLSDWKSVGCLSYRATADVSADGDPYTGEAVYDSSSACRYTTAPFWCTVGGTSLSTPLIAGVFALAGGSHGVSYPAETLYERAREDPTGLHDIKSGSNGKCFEQEFNSELLPFCTAAQEAVGCNETRICLAGEGYSGPTGLGTPDGIAAFAPVTTTTTTTTTTHTTVTTVTGSASSHIVTTTTVSTPGEPSGVSGAETASAAPVPVLSRLVLSDAAKAALRNPRPEVSTIAFSFSLSEAARVSSVLSRRVVTHHRAHWERLGDSLTLTAAKGSDHERLSAHGRLRAGVYLLTVTPLHGVARSITLLAG
jgi:subtilase family serine protease